MIWEFKAFGRYLVLVGTLGAVLFLLLGVLCFKNESEVVACALYFSLFLLLYPLIKSITLCVNPVLLRLTDDGVYVRDKYFFKYEDIVAFTKSYFYFKGLPQEQYFLLVQGTGEPSINSFWKSGFTLMRHKDKNGVMHVRLPYSVSMNHTYEDVLGEMFVRYRKKTGDVLSSNYWPDLYVPRKV